MRTTPLYVTDKLSEISALVSTDVLPKLNLANSTISAVQFYHGHPLEIIETLAQKDQSDTVLFQKYPAICLFQDIREIMNPRSGIYCQTPELNMAILYPTDPVYKAQERLERTFKPILYPIYFSLLKNIVLHRSIEQKSVENLVHDKFDRLYWGRGGLYGNEANIFNDWVDAIEIRNLSLNFYFPDCM